MIQNELFFSSHADPEVRHRGEFMCRMVSDLALYIRESVIADPAKTALGFQELPIVPDGEGSAEHAVVWPLWLPKREHWLLRDFTLASLQAHSWNMVKTARTMGIGRQTLYTRVSDYGLKNPNVKS